MNSWEESIRRSLAGSKWEKIGIYSHKGFNLPLSAIRSKDSCGIGEFLDLIPLIEWCSSLKMDVIQLLPLNDSGFDPSPYNALSSLALHPVYLSLQALSFPKTEPFMGKIKALQAFNQSPRVPFQKVLTAKLEFLLLYFNSCKDQIVSSSEFISFLEDNPWLKPYGLFKVFKEKLGDLPSFLWDAEKQHCPYEEIERLFESHKEECLFPIVLQYFCFSQMKAVKKAAEEKKVLLKGDLPILISPDSVDVWIHSNLFDSKLAVGAPPDQYSQEGQYWGFPMPKWDEMRKEHFFWWKNRLRYASHFYDLYRIDHAVGLFRLWAIPLNKKSLEGSFIPADPSLWEPLGKELLHMLLESSSMLPIAEDLGTVPPFVRTLLNELAIAGTKVMRWERNWNTDRSFIDPSHYPKISLTCLSTHDSTTLEGWWNKETAESKVYAEQKGLSYLTPLPIEYRKQFLKESLSSNSLFHINLLGEYLALVPGFVSSDPEEERINVPGTLLPSNWTYRFKPSLEEMIASNALKTAIIELF